MARRLSTTRFAASLEVEAAAPLDARTRVEDMVELVDPASFPFPYEGLKVYVKSEKKTYTLVGNDTTNIANWDPEGSGGGSGDTFVEITDAEIDALFA